MIRADEAGRLARTLGAEFRAAMPAGVVEAAQRALAVADDDDGCAADVQRLIAAGGRKLDLEADQDPGAAEDRFLIEGEDLVVVIERLGQRVSRFARSEGGLDPGVVSHPQSPIDGHSELRPSQHCVRYVTRYRPEWANLICSCRHRISGSGGGWSVAVPANFA